MQISESSKPQSTFKTNLWFVIHLVFLIGSWVAPFMITWKFLIPIYSLVLLQFVFFGRCLMNSEHGLDDSDNHTFYAELMEKFGLRPNRKKVRGFVRSWIYLVFVCVAFVWQVVLGHSPLLF